MASDDEDNIGPDSDIVIVAPKTTVDLATVLGVLCAMGLIVAAIIMGQSNANFINGPSFMIVIFGTIAATATAYSGKEFAKAGSVLSRAVLRKTYSPATMARQLLSLAVLARKKGLLALSSAEEELRKDPYLAKAVQLVTDGYTSDNIHRILGQEVDSLAERHRRGASILRRAAEVAPAMGLIGTLVGLVQMLAQLNDPASIGPSMAVALLTTFYGAILGTIVMAPMAAKLERNSNEETLILNLIMTAVISIANQENPRNLEIILNSELPPDERVRFFE